MKRIVVIAVILFSVCLAGVLSLPFILSSDFIRGRILSQLTSLTGSEVSFRGDPSVSFSPFLGIELSDLKIKDPNSQNNEESLLRTESVKAKLDIFPALFGNIEISQYQLVRPELRLTKRPEGKSSWNFTSGGLHDVLEAAGNTIDTSSADTTQPAKLGSFNIVDGTAIYLDTTTNKKQKMSGITGSVVWENSASDIAAKVSAIWQNEAVEVDFNVAEPLKIFAGGQSQISANLKSAPLQFQINGQGNMLSNLFVEGDMEAETPSISRLNEFLGTGIDNLGIFGTWRATGKLNASRGSALLSDATLQINDQVATGVVRFENAATGNRKLDGTLAFDQVQLADYLQAAEGRQEEIGAAGPTNLDIDLRVSANSIDTGRFTLENVAAAIRSRQTGWQFDIGNAEAFGGSLVAQVVSEVADNVPQLSIKFNTKASDAKALESLLGIQDWALDGALDLKGDLRTQLSSSSLPDLKFNGELEASSNDGTLEGISLNDVFESIQEGKLGVVSNDTSDGQTDYENLNLKVFLSNNTASISQASIQTSDNLIQFLGDADLSKGTLAIRAQRLGTDGPIPGRIIIGGTLKDPLVTIRGTPGATDVHPEEQKPEEDIDLEENKADQEAG